MLSHDQFAAAGQTPAVAGTHAVALYDSTGRVRHMHHVVLFEGGKEADQFGAEREALKHAAALGHDVSQLKALHVPNVNCLQTAHNVDLEKLALIFDDQPAKTGATEGHFTHQCRN